MLFKASIACLALAILPATPLAQNHSPPANIGSILYRSWTSDGTAQARPSPLPVFSFIFRSINDEHVLIHEEEDNELLGTAIEFRGVLRTHGWIGERQFKLNGDLAPLRALWPLAPGKRAELDLEQMFQRTNDRGEEWQPSGDIFTYRFRVVDEQREVTVPAGTFQAWEIVREELQRSATQPIRQIAETRLWYAPALNWWIRSERLLSQPSSKRLLVREARGVVR